MDTSSPTETAPTSPAGTIPPIECATWCVDGAGHTGAGHPDDQYCIAGYLELELAREAPEQIIPGGDFHRQEMVLSLQRDPFAEPYISWSAGGGLVKLTPAEARQFGAHLVHLADLAEQGLA